jgi:hypothetical protein
MGAFRNQTKKPVFDAHGREVQPGQIIGVEDDASQADSAAPEPEPGPPDGNGKSKGAAGPQPEPRGSKAATR